MRFLIMIALASFSFNAFALKQNPVIDPAFQKVEAQYKKENKKKGCNEIKNLSESMACDDLIRDKLKVAGNWRGSEEYLERHLKPLAIKPLSNKYVELRLLRSKTKSPYFNNFPSGSLTADILGSEITWIELELKRRWRNENENAFWNLKKLRNRAMKAEDAQ
jgi:hypothetical protein